MAGATDVQAMDRSLTRSTPRRDRNVREQPMPHLRPSALVSFARSLIPNMRASFKHPERPQ
jgi:hypothetical protein